MGFFSYIYVSFDLRCVADGLTYDVSKFFLTYMSLLTYDVSLTPVVGATSVSSPRSLCSPRFIVGLYHIGTLCNTL